MKVQMLVGGQNLKFDIHTELNFDPEHVFDVIGKQPGMLSWWYSLAAMKDQEVNDFTSEMEKRMAEIELEVRSDTALLEAQYGKVTEGVIKAAIQAKDEPSQLKAKLNEMRRDAAILKAMAKGFDSRSALLATAGSAQRAEVEARLRQLVGKAKNS